MATNVDFQYYAIGWTGNWENTITEAESVISNLRETAMLSDGFVSFNRYRTVSSADYRRSSETLDQTTIPYCLIETVNLRVNKTLRIQKVFVVITDMPTVSTTAISSEEKRDDAQPSSVSRNSRDGKIK